MSKILSLYRSRTGEDPAAAQLLARLQAAGYGLTGLKMEAVLRVEKEGLTPEDLRQLELLFCHPLVERMTLTTALPENGGETVEVSYQRGWTDPEWPSIQHAAKALGISGIEWARLSTRYQLAGVSREMVKEIATRFLFNAQSQLLLDPEHGWTTLKPQGQAGGVELFDVAVMSAEELTALSEKRRLFLAAAALSAIQSFYRAQNRPARDAELEVIAGWWGDHCFHTTWKSLGLLQAIQEATAAINHPLVISAFADNAGVVRFFGGWALNLKGETHISPTAVEPFGGDATKHGGVIRDIIFTGQGGWPWAGTTVLATGNPFLPWMDVPTGALHPRYILSESIGATAYYCNPMGIPMAHSEYLWHPANWKPFNLGHSLGVLPEARAQKGVPHFGDLVVLIGGETGRDGLHGATVSSGAMTAATIVTDAAHVQIGMPIIERNFMEAVPVLRDADCIRAGNDCGAAGLSSAEGEMGKEVRDGERLTSGAWINLAWVPLKCAGMKPWEIKLSESQERGVLAVPPEKLALALEILGRFGVSAAVIGVFTDSECLQAVYDPSINSSAPAEEWTLSEKGEVAVDLPYDFLAKGCPLPAIEVREPGEPPQPFVPPVPANEREWVELAKRVLGHYHVSNQSVAAHQFDQTVQGNTVASYIAGEGEDVPNEIFAATPVLGQPWTAGVAVVTNQFYGEVDPARQGQLVYAGAVARLVAAGFSPERIVTNVNVYTPRVTDKPENAWRLVQLVKEGYAAASMALGVPVISGKDSSSGTFFTKEGERIDVPLTISVLALGSTEHWMELVPKTALVPGDKLVLFTPGLRERALGGSILYDLYGQRGTVLPELDLRELRAGWQKYHQLWQESAISARSAIGESGLLRRAFEMSWGGGCGCRLNLPNDAFGWLFGEFHGAILFAPASDHWLDELDEVLGGEAQIIGEVLEEPIMEVNCSGERLFSAPLVELARDWQKTFAEVAR